MEKITNKFKLNRIDIRLVILTVCFIGAAFIDMGRTNGNWDVWRNANRCLGLIVATVSLCATGIGNKRLLPYGIASAVSLLLILTVPVWPFEIVPWHRADARLIVLNVLVIGIAFIEALIARIGKIRNTEGGFKGVFSNPGRLFKDNYIGITAVVFWLLATVSPNHTYWPGYSLILLILLLLTPFSKEDLIRTVKGFALGTVIGFLAIQTIAWGFRPYTKEMIRYSGFYFNSNMLDLICLTVLVICLFGMYASLKEDKPRILKTVISVATAALAISLIVMSMGRLSIVLAFGFAGIFMILLLIFLKGKRKRVLKLWGICIASLIVAFPITFASVEYLPRILKHPIVINYDYNWVDLENPDNYVTVEDFIDEFGDRSKKLVTVTEKNDSSTDDANVSQTGPNPLIDYSKIKDPDFSEDKYYASYAKRHSGIKVRIVIWKTYLHNLNLTGHNPDEMRLYYSPYKQTYHAHNIFINTAYLYGIPAGILFVISVAEILVTLVCGFIRRKDNVYIGTVFGAIILLTVFGLAELDWQFGQLLWFALLLVQGMLKCDAGCSKNEHML